MTKGYCSGEGRHETDENGVVIDHSGLHEEQWCYDFEVATFDHYCDENNITPNEAPAAFAAFLNLTTGWDGEMRQVGGNGA